jgi:hypothetical protein
MRLIFRFTGSEGCCCRSQQTHTPVRTDSILCPTSEQLYRDPTHERIHGIAWEDHGANPFHPRTFDKGDDGEADE